MLKLPKAWWICSGAQLAFWIVAVGDWSLPHWWSWPMVLAWQICIYTCGQISERHRIEQANKPPIEEPRL